MKPAFSRFPFTALVLLVLLLAAVGQAHWYPDDPDKWVQMPDESTNGLDVACYSPRIVGDDFLCISPGPITNIHIWGSWFNDERPQDANVVFHLQIAEDCPAHDCSELGYSFPTNVVWGPHTISGPLPNPWANLPEGLEEGWYDPRYAQYVPFADNGIWQYNFNIPEEEAFH